MLRLTARQRDAVLEAEARLNVFDGSVSAGKTVASLIRWLQFIRQGPPGNLAMIGKTERTLKHNVIDLLVEWLGSKRCRLVAGSGELWVCGRRVYIYGANDQRSETKIRGLSLVGAYCDEITTWPESFWGMLLSRLRQPGAKLFGTTNPDHPAHWLKRDYLDRADELDLYRARFRLADNTELDPAYVEAISREYTGLWRRRYIDGEWVAAEGAVYGDVWDPDRHLERETPELRRIWSGIDYGTTNPFVELLTGLGADGRLHIFAEWRWDSRSRLRSLTAGQYRQELERWHQERRVRPEWVFVDPEEAGFRVELQQNGWRGVRAADNAVIEGIRLVSDLLALDKLRVHASCEGLVEEFPGYVWDPDAQQDRPIKADDHSLDAARYALLSSEFMWRSKVLGPRAAVA